MNLDYIVYNLEEAKKQLDSMINEIKSNPNYDYGEYVVAISHLYHHINTAWNSRDVSNVNAENCSQEDFDKWGKFPDGDELFLNN